MKIQMLIDGQEVNLTPAEMRQVIEANQVIERAKNKVKIKTTVDKKPQRHKRHDKGGDYVAYFKANSHEIENDHVLFLQDKDYSHLMLSEDILLSYDTGRADLIEGQHIQIEQRKAVINYFIKANNNPSTAKQLAESIGSFGLNIIQNQVCVMVRLGILSRKDGKYFLSSKFISQ